MGPPLPPTPTQGRGGRNAAETPNPNKVPNSFAEPPSFGRGGTPNGSGKEIQHPTLPKGAPLAPPAGFRQLPKEEEGARRGGV